MAKYYNSDYAKNKKSEDIVYVFNVGGSIVTLDKFLKENPDLSKEDFEFLKSCSDGMFFIEDRADSLMRKKINSNLDVSEINLIEEVDFIGDIEPNKIDVIKYNDISFYNTNRNNSKNNVKEFEEIFQEFDIDYKESIEMLNIIFENIVITNMQKKRFVLYYFGFSLRKIAEIENVSHIAVRKSIEYAKSKIKKYVLQDKKNNK